MLTPFLQAFKTPDLRRKILFTLGILVVFRFGSQLPTPGVDVEAVDTQRELVQGTGVYGMLNMFTGGALLQLAVFALGIMPYITASIIMQLLRVVIPRLEMLHKEGQAGQTKITQYTRYLTIGLAILQSTTIISMARTGALLQSNTSLLVNDDISTIVIMVITMTAGTAVIMWLGELITERGVGNGMSLLIFTQIIATFPASLWRIQQQQGWTTFTIVAVIGLIVVVLVVFVEMSQRRIPVQYAKRMVGRRMYGGSSTYIPLKINQAGVIPVIFASSLLYVPLLASQFNQTAGWSVWIQRYFVTGSHPIYMASFFLLIVFFTFFYVSIRSSGHPMPRRGVRLPQYGVTDMRFKRLQRHANWRVLLQGGLIRTVGGRGRTRTPCSGPFSASWSPASASATASGGTCCGPATSWISSSA